MMVSVVLPTYNSESYIVNTIQSVLQQSHRDLELIVVDDCSSDNTIRAIQTFAEKDNRVTLIRLDKNSGGPARPRNTGVATAKGEWVAFIDSDDYWHPEKLAIQVGYIQQNPSVQFVSSLKKVVRQLDFNFEIFLPGLPIQKIGHKNLLIKNIINNSSVVVRKDLLELFDEHKKTVAVEDAKQWLAITLQGIECHCIELPLYLYIQRGDSISRNKWKMLLKRLRLLRNYKDTSNCGLSPVTIFLLLTKYFYRSVF